MQKYSYTAISKIGEKITGEEAAEDERQLARVLRERGYILTTAKSQEKKSKRNTLAKFSSMFQRVSLVEKLMFTRNLQVMVSAGTPLPKTLGILAEQTRSKYFAKAITGVREDVVQGKTLSESMEAYPQVFPELFVNMIKAGEASGTLEKVMDELTLQLEREHDIRSKVFGALLYPAVIISAMALIGTLMLALVVPQLAAVFEELGVELPLPTQVIVAIGVFVGAYWFVVIPSGIATVIILFRLSRTKEGKRVTDTLLLRAPILSGIIRKTNAALMTRTLSSLIASGIPIVKAIQITSHVVGNTHFQVSLAAAAEKVGKGAKLSDSLRPYKSLYPLVVVQMIAVGEETGETGTILAKLANFFEGEVEQVTKNLTSIIEPILMLVIGGAVGFFAVSMIQPMYGLLSAIE
jgi:type IV pilus assembly protein PilC